MKITSYRILFWLFVAMLFFAGVLTATDGLATNIRQQSIDPLAVEIVGGQNVPEPNPYTWQVSIGYRDVPNEDDRNLGHFCGGSVIDKRWILTAAHCLEYAPNRYEDADDLRVIIGRRTRSIADEGIEIDVLHYTVHTGYRGIDSGNDIALILLKQDIPDYQTYVIPLMSEELENTFASVGTLATVTGWGGLKGYGVGSAPPRDQTFADVLQWVQIPIVSQITCNEAIGGGVRASMLCAGFEVGGKDACQNDSGGPLVVPDGKGHYIQVGIVSFGLGCAAPDVYGVYTRVSAFRNWVEETTNLTLPMPVSPTPTSTSTSAPTLTPTATPTTEALIAPTGAPEPSDILTPVPTWTVTRQPSRPTPTKRPTSTATPVWTPLPISTSSADEPRLNPDIDPIRDPIYDPTELFDIGGPEPALIASTISITDSSVGGSSNLGLDLKIDIGNDTPTAGRPLRFEFDFENLRMDRTFYGVVLLVEIPAQSRFHLPSAALTNGERARNDIAEPIWELPDGSGICPDGHPAHSTCLLRLGTVVSGQKRQLNFNIIIDADARLDTELRLDALLKAADLTDKQLIAVAASNRVQVVESLSTVPTALDILDEPRIDYRLFLPFVVH